MSAQAELLSGATVLITGASGFLGRSLALRLAQTRDVRIIAASRQIPYEREAPLRKIEWVQTDVSMPEPVERLIEETKPDIIYHLASDSRGGREAELVPASFKNDVQTTVNMLVAVQRIRCRRFVMTASLEDVDPVPVSPYAAAKMTCKLYGEMFHSLYGMPLTFLRPFMTYGPGQKSYKLIPYVIESLLRGESPVISSGSRLIDWVYSDDVIEAFVAAATASAAPGRVFDLGAGVLVAVEEVVELLRSLVPDSPPATYRTSNSRGKEIVRCADVQPAVELLGWQPKTTLAEGLARTVHWYQHRIESASG